MCLNFFLLPVNACWCLMSENITSSIFRQLCVTHKYLFLTFILSIRKNVFLYFWFSNLNSRPPLENGLFCSSFKNFFLLLHFERRADVSSSSASQKMMLLLFDKIGSKKMSSKSICSKSISSKSISSKKIHFFRTNLVTPNLNLGM